MPVKQRVAKERRPTVTGEVLDLFLELEHRPRDRYRECRRDEEFNTKSQRLAALLNLSSEWWMMQHVNDRSRGPCHPPWCSAHAACHRVREVRKQLLAAVAGTQTLARRRR
jgi:hypothetical protein